MGTGLCLWLFVTTISRSLTLHGMSFLHLFTLLPLLVVLQADLVANTDEEQGEAGVLSTAGAMAACAMVFEHWVEHLASVNCVACTLMDAVDVLTGVAPPEERGPAAVLSGLNPCLTAPRNKEEGEVASALSWTQALGGLGWPQASLLLDAESSGAGDGVARRHARMAAALLFRRRPPGCFPLRTIYSCAIRLLCALHVLCWVRQTEVYGGDGKGQRRRRSRSARGWGGTRRCRRS